MSAADIQLEALGHSLEQIDQSDLIDIPDEEKSSLLPGAGSSEAVVEPKYETAEVERERQQPIPCLIPTRSDGKPCRDKNFTHWAALKKHLADFHTDKEKGPVGGWTWEKNRPVLKKEDEDTNLYDGYEEDPGPMVACRCILFILL